MTGESKSGSCTKWPHACPFQNDKSTSGTQVTRMSNRTLVSRLVRRGRLEPHPAGDMKRVATAHERMVVRLGENRPCCFLTSLWMSSSVPALTQRNPR